MVANEGVMDLLLNFICSANSANIDVSSIMVSRFSCVFLFCSNFDVTFLKGVCWS